MSRFLAEALGANDPKFRHALMSLERRSGHPNHDLRLTSAILSQVRTKVTQLGLDPEDTTAEELYHRLNHKLVDQDKDLTKTIRLLASKEADSEASLTDGLISLVKSLDFDPICFSLKSTVLRRNLKDQPPKKVMKALGYRSVDSMLKLEPAVLILLAINAYESEAYLNSFYARYKKYSPSDFELRELKVISPKSKRWQSVLNDIKERTGLTLVSNYETASIVLLPIDDQPKSGYMSIMVANLMSELEVIKATSNYLKLHQVNSDFSSRLLDIIEHEPYLKVNFLSQSITWRTAQHILKDVSGEQYAPHLVADELIPENFMAKLAEVITDFKFWQDSHFLALVKSAETTSLNVLDVAANLVNELPFDKRRTDHLRQALSSQLAGLYVAPEEVLDDISGEKTNQPLLNPKDNVLVG